MRSTDTPVYRLHTAPKDLGVLLVLFAALALALALRFQIENRTTVFQDPDSPFRIAYPATWTSVEPLQDVLLNVEDPQTASVYKTTLTVESRELDPQAPPTLQDLVDRRVVQRSTLTGYHFLSNTETAIGEARGAQIEYAYVVQPIDTPRRASLPVVVQAREYIVVTRDRTYYITLAAPEADFAGASARLDRMFQTVQIQ